MLALHTIVLPYIFLTVVNCYRTSVCTGQNEEFSLCGWKCPPTCVNLRLLGMDRAFCPHRWECHVGCRCSAGYLRDEYSGNCVLVHECPKTAKCPPGKAMGVNLRCIERRRKSISNETQWENYKDYKLSDV